MAENHIDTATPNQQPGVSRPSKGHFMLCDEDRRVLTVLDMGGGVSIGGLYITDPEAITAFCSQLNNLATALRSRQQR